MKAGRTIKELAQELNRQRAVKRDFVVDTRSVRMAEDGKTLVLADKPAELNVEEFTRLMAQPVNGPLIKFMGEATRHCHGQIATKLAIPMKYYERMQAEAPALLARNVNCWLDHNPTMRMTRTLDGRFRAYLSNRYRPRDNWDLMEHIYPKLVNKKLSLESCEVTETKFYLKAVWTERKEIHWIKGDGTGPHDFYEEYQPGIVIGNSEVGSGSTYVSPGVYVKACTNLAVFSSEGIRKYHLGRSYGNGEDEEIQEYVSDATIQKDDAAFFSKVADTVDACLDGKLFTDVVDKMKSAQTDEIKSNVKEVVEVVQKNFGLTENEGGGVLEQLARTGNLTRLGLSQAITRVSQDVESYDRASELERIGGQIIELEKKNWLTLVA